jgi:hypothetical protein
VLLEEALGFADAELFFQGEVGAKGEQRGVDVLGADPAVRGDERGAEQHVLELADVAGPGMAGEARQGAGGDPFLPDLGGEGLEEVVRQEGEVAEALAQRRDLDGQHREAVEEVLAELPLGDPVLEGDPGGGDDAGVDLPRLGGADGLDLAVLQGPEQLGLGAHRKLPDLVEEEGPALGRGEGSGVGGDGAGEGALLVAEELRVDELRGERPHVEREERAPGVEAAAVEGLGDELLAAAGLAADQHGGAERGEAADLPREAQHRRGSADHAVQRRLAGEVLGLGRAGGDLDQGATEHEAALPVEGGLRDPGPGDVDPVAGADVAHLELAPLDADLAVAGGDRGVLQAHVDAGGRAEQQRPPLVDDETPGDFPVADLDGPPERRHPPDLADGILIADLRPLLLLHGPSSPRGGSGCVSSNFFHGARPPW